MKKIDYLILTIFSVVILIASIIIILLSAGFLDMNTVGNFLGKAITGANTHTTVIVISVIFAVLSVKGIFFADFEKDKKSKETGILMENGNGKLMISKSSLENLVSSVVNEFESAEDIKTAIKIDENNNLKVLVNIVVSKDVIIKELTLNLQNKIKEAIKKTSDLEVKEVDIQIRNISTPHKDNK